jgi:FPC/CPF motif-containing protein YcgG
MKHASPGRADRETIWHVEPEEARRIESRLREFIAEPDYPCVGAKAALARDSLQILVACDLGSGWDDLRIHESLLDWSRDYERDPEDLRSLAIVFAGPGDLDETAFERAMWERLQSLADKDEWRGQSYDKGVSPDPADPHFSLSFGGQAYFVVGLHPNASRPARRFAWPTLVFNLHDQFERLREDGRYAKIRRTVLERDLELAGSINPMLQVHGEGSEARQYSGRVVPEDWTCPFHDKRDKT